MNSLYEEIVNEFSIYPEYNTDVKGPSWLLPDGSFLLCSRAHGEIDEFVLSQLNIDLKEDTMSLPWKSRSGYLMDCNCVRINDGKRGFRGDVYIELPTDPLTEEQYDSLESWLQNITQDEIDISCEDKYLTYNLIINNVQSIISRIRLFYVKNEFISL